MVFVLKQLNSITRNFQDFDSITYVTAAAFGATGAAAEAMPKVQRHVYENEKLPWQLFYVMDGDVVVASLIILVRNSMVEGKKDLLFSAVNTNPEYRRIGIMDELFSYVFRIYEDRESIVVDPRFSVSEETGKECFDFVAQTGINDFYWTLYSMVFDYYKKFGFHAFNNLNYYEQKPSLIVTDEEFNLTKTEKYINADNVIDFMHDPKYIPFPYKSTDPNERSCGFESSAGPSFSNRFTKMVNLNGQKLDHFGLHIKDDAGESFIIITQHFGPMEAMVQRMYTSVEGNEKMAKHLERLYLYLGHYFKTNYAKFNNNELGKKGQIIWFAVNDIFATTEESKQITIDFISKEKGWTWDESNAENLPMLREFKAGPVDGLKWTYNGFYQYD